MSYSKNIFHAKAQRRKAYNRFLCVFASLRETRQTFPMSIIFFMVFMFCFVETTIISANDSLEEAAFRAATERVAASVVRLETVGGAERAEGVVFGEGPTTGLIIDADGYVVSSEFNFLRRPDSILVRLADGRRKAAGLVATDHSRKLVLLKIELDENEKGKLPLPEFVARDKIRVGQWAIAVGRAFDGEQPNISVGVASAVNRIWGKAVQTDAKISPNNYGGPLVDIHGRVMGVLTPLSPEGNSAADALAWYDSGIGFAVPAADVLRSVELMKRGRDLDGGFLGVGFKGPNPNTSEAVLGACLPDSPAAKAGLKPGDRIVKIDGRAIARAADVLEAVERGYAGDKIAVTVQRDGKEFQAEIELAVAPKAIKRLSKNDF